MRVRILKRSKSRESSTNGVSARDKLASESLKRKSHRGSERTRAKPVQANKPAIGTILGEHALAGETRLKCFTRMKYGKAAQDAKAVQADEASDRNETRSKPLEREAKAYDLIKEVIDMNTMKKTPLRNCESWHPGDEASRARARSR